MQLELASPVRSAARDAELIARAQRGELRAFEELIRVRLDKLFRTACGILRDPAEAEDATQDACLQAWQKLPTLRDLGRLDAWLGRILINTCRMRLRDRRRVREIPIDDNRPMSELTDPIGPAGRAEDVDRVNRALDRVSVEDRALLVLHHVHRERLETIAASLGIPVGTVKWRLSRARQAVQLALETDR